MSIDCSLIKVVIKSSSLCTEVVSWPFAIFEEHWWWSLLCWVGNTHSRPFLRAIIASSSTYITPGNLRYSCTTLFEHDDGLHLYLQVMKPLYCTCIANCYTILFTVILAHDVVYMNSCCVYELMLCIWTHVVYTGQYRKSTTCVISGIHPKQHCRG